MNGNGRLLDLVFANLPEHLDQVEPPIPLLPIDEHHPALVLLLEASSDHSTRPDEGFDNINYDFNRCDFNELREAFAATEWDVLLNIATVDGTVSAFYERIHAVCNDFVPRRRRTSSSLFNMPWWTSELRHLRNLLRKALCRDFLSKSENDKTSLRELESTYKTVMLSTYENYLLRIHGDIK